jgi:hypothetical protein
MATINTCKMIGRLEYVLNQQRIPFKATTRNDVKYFVFNKYYLQLKQEIEKNITRKGRLKIDGTERKASFHYVDDRIVIKAMKLFFRIETPKPGKTNRYGIKEHAWQALSLVAWWFDKEGIHYSPNKI